jgi:hypothetical protein
VSTNQHEVSRSHDKEGLHVFVRTDKIILFINFCTFHS